MRVTRKIPLFLPLFILLSACKTNPSSSYTPSSSDSEAIPSSTSEIIDYQRDEEGFFILEEDYFRDYEDSTPGLNSKISYSNNREGLDKYASMRLYAGAHEIPLHNILVNASNTWSPTAPNRIPNGVGIFALEGKVELKVQTNFLIYDRFSISPESRNVSYQIDEARRVVTFRITQPDNYVLQFRSGRTLHLFINPFSEFDVGEETNQIIRFGPGEHTASNSSYINSNHMIPLSSNTTVILEAGSVVHGGFIANNATNIKIIGPGIVTGERFDRNATTGTKLIPFEFNYCTNLIFKEFALLDPAGWAFNIYFCNDVILDNIKIISSRANGDGVSLQSSQNVICRNSFIRTWDDSLVVKNYPMWSNRNIEGETRNILFENCSLWTDLAQSMEIGYETVGEVMENIIFRNITVIHNYHKAPISIHNGNNAHIKNIVFENITIEDAAMGRGDGVNVLIDFSTQYSPTWSDGHKVTSLGEIDGVLIHNVLVVKGTANPVVSVKGTIDKRTNYLDRIHPIKNVVFSDISIYEERLTALYPNYIYNEYTENITFVYENEVTGALIRDAYNADDYTLNISII